MQYKRTLHVVPNATHVLMGSCFFWKKIRDIKISSFVIPSVIIIILTRMDWWFLTVVSRLLVLVCAVFFWIVWHILLIDWFLVFNATFSNISAISWRHILLQFEDTNQEVTRSRNSAIVVRVWWYLCNLFLSLFKLDWHN